MERLTYKVIEKVTVLPDRITPGGYIECGMYGYIYEDHTDYYRAKAEFEANKKAKKDERSI